MLGAHLGDTVASSTSFCVALVAVPLARAVAGAVPDRFGLRYLDDRPLLDLVLVTFGLTLAIDDVVPTTWEIPGGPAVWLRPSRVGLWGAPPPRTGRWRRTAPSRRPPVSAARPVGKPEARPVVGAFLAQRDHDEQGRTT